MCRYRVIFFKSLLGVDGHPDKCLQRSIVIRPSTGEARLAVLKRDEAGRSGDEIGLIPRARRRACARAREESAPDGLIGGRWTAGTRLNAWAGLPQPGSDHGEASHGTIYLGLMALFMACGMIGTRQSSTSSAAPQPAYPAVAHCR